MSPHRIVSVAVLCAALLATVGCSAFEYQFRSGKLNIHSFTETSYESSDYEILGPVTAEGEGMTVLGIFAEGEDGQGLLWDAARAQYGDEVTGLKDITSNSEWLSVLGFVYARVETTYRAIAIKES